MTIRPVHPNDYPQILEIYSPYVTDSIVTFETIVPSVAAMAERIEKICAQAPWLVAELDGRVVGYAYAGSHRWRDAYAWNRELSAYIDQSYHRRGIATRLYRCLIELIQLQGFNNALAGITKPNAQSEGFHASLGFKETAVYHNIGYKIDRYHDVGWWELPLHQDLSRPPAPLKKPQELWAMPQAHAALEKYSD